VRNVAPGCAIPPGTSEAVWRDAKARRGDGSAVRFCSLPHHRSPMAQVRLQQVGRAGIQSEAMYQARVVLLEVIQDLADQRSPIGAPHHGGLLPGRLARIGGDHGVELARQRRPLLPELIGLEARTSKTGNPGCSMASATGFSRRVWRSRHSTGPFPNQVESA